MLNQQILEQERRRAEEQGLERQREVTLQNIVDADFDRQQKRAREEAELAEADAVRHEKLLERTQQTLQKFRADTLQDQEQARVERENELAKYAERLAARKDDKDAILVELQQVKLQVAAMRLQREAGGGGGGGVAARPPTRPRRGGRRTAAEAAEVRLGPAADRLRVVRPAEPGRTALRAEVDGHLRQVHETHQGFHVKVGHQQDHRVRGATQG